MPTGCFSLTLVSFHQLCSIPKLMVKFGKHFCIHNCLEKNNTAILKEPINHNLCLDLDSSRSQSASQVALVVKNSPANAGHTRDLGSIPGLGRSPGGGHGNPLRYSCLENPMDRGAWWATVHAVMKSRTRLK